MNEEQQSQPGSQNQTATPQMPPPPVKGQGWALASLILGVISIPTVFLCGIGGLFGAAAVITGIIALVKLSGSDAGQRKGFAIGGICVGASIMFFSIFFLAMGAGMLLPALNSAREKARRIGCASNLKQIGLAIKMYEVDNNDQLPSGKGVEGFNMLIKLKYLDDNMFFVCPTTGTQPAAPGQPLTEDTVSYIYLGAGKSEADNPDTAIVVEKPNNHNRYGNILFLDGHVQGFSGESWIENANVGK